MARKAKKKVHPMPKLGWKDQLVYWTAILLTAAGALFSLFFPIYYRHELKFNNANAISCADGEGSLHFLWLFFWLLFAVIFLVTVYYQYRRPIFGRSDIRYGPPAYPPIYPLLMKNKPKKREKPKVLAQKRKYRIILTGILLITLAFSVALFPRSLYGRYELLRDGTVQVYDSRNRQAEYYSLGDIESVRLDTNRTSGGRYSSGRWYARMTIFFLNGERCDFSIMSFGDDWPSAIEMAEKLKVIYGPLFYIEGKENLWRVVRDQDMTAENEALLKVLFEVD